MRRTLNRNDHRRLVNVQVPLILQQMVEAHQGQPITSYKENPNVVITRVLRHYYKFVFNVLVAGLQHPRHLRLVHLMGLPQRGNIRTLQQIPFPLCLEEEEPPALLIGDDLRVVEVEEAAEAIEREAGAEDSFANCKCKRRVW